jgi:hypothetical protein
MISLLGEWEAKPRKSWKGQVRAYDVWNGNKRVATVYGNDEGAQDRARLIAAAPALANAAWTCVIEGNREEGWARLRVALRDAGVGP